MRTPVRLMVSDGNTYFVRSQSSPIQSASTISELAPLRHTALLSTVASFSSTISLTQLRNDWTGVDSRPASAISVCLNPSSSRIRLLKSENLDEKPLSLHNSN